MDRNLKAKEGLKEKLEENKLAMDKCTQCGTELVKDKFLPVKFGKKEFRMCSTDCKNEFLEVMKKERSTLLEKAGLDVKMRERELAYKKSQIGTTVLEKNESNLYNTCSFPKDEVKPIFLLKNEIDMIEFLIKNKIDEIKNMEELKEEDAKPT